MVIFFCLLLASKAEFSSGEDSFYHIHENIFKINKIKTNYGQKKASLDFKFQFIQKLHCIFASVLKIHRAKMTCSNRHRDLNGSKVPKNKKAGKFKSNLNPTGKSLGSQPRDLSPQLSVEYWMRKQQMSMSSKFIVNKILDFDNQPEMARLSMNISNELKLKCHLPLLIFSSKMEGRS